MRRLAFTYFTNGYNASVSNFTDVSLREAASRGTAPLPPSAQVLFTLASLARRQRGTQVFPGPARCPSSTAELKVSAANLFISSSEPREGGSQDENFSCIFKIVPQNSKDITKLCFLFAYHVILSVRLRIPTRH